ncbi:MAG: hypothetical protein IPM48_10785 [Saprospiraceae bacterium]|nr:hypothetical protein [Saprospiraceae bacterium]
MLRFQSTLVFLLILLNVHSQNSKVAQNNEGIFVDIHLGYGSALAQLSDRYGPNQCVGLGLSYEPPQYHFPIGIKWTYLFGTRVYEDVLKPYRTSDLGQIIGEDGFQTDVRLRQRAFNIQIFTGGIFSLGSQSMAKHGLKWSLGLGFLQHRIRIQDDSRSASQINLAFRQGHDRLTNGLSVTGFIGYEFRSHSGRINFYTGFEPILGFTQSRRSYNYDTMQSESGISRKDIYLQFKFGWYLPFFIGDYGEKFNY